MFRKCKHKWNEVHRDVRPRARSVDNFEGTSEQLDELTGGATFIELRCKVCGDVKCVKLAGQHPLGPEE